MEQADAESSLPTRLRVLVPPGDVLEVSGWSELESVLRELVPDDAENRVLVSIRAGDGDGDYPGMHIGISRGEDVPLLWSRPDGDDDVSVAPAPVAEDGELEFRWGGDYTWLMRSECVPQDDAIEAVRRWLETGTRPDGITWQDS